MGSIVYAALNFIIASADPLWPRTLGIAPGHPDYNAAAPPAQSSDVRIPVMIGIDETDVWTTASTSCRSETVFLMDVFLMDRVFFVGD